MSREKNLVWLAENVINLRINIIFPVCFYSTVGVNMFYLCIIVYLYGDLAIYAAAVPMSLMEVAWWV